jgi:putative ABC transport system ATP-binding protein
LLLCDEPTGNLDSVTSEGIMRLLSALNSDGTTILVITHDPAIAAHTRRHVRIRDGILTSDDLDPVGR